MKTSSRISSILLFLLVSTTTSAGEDPAAIPGAGGVRVDLGQDLSPTKTMRDQSNQGVAVAIPTAISLPAQPAATDPEILPLPVKLVEAAAEEPAGDATFKAIVKAMKPKKPVQSLDGKEVSVYLSEKVAVARLETDAKRLKVENGRLHVATLYSEQRDSVLHSGLAVDTSFFSSFRLSFGTRTYIALLNQENTDAFAAAFGLEAAYNLPFKALPLEFAASFYYAPDILTFGASDRAVDAQLDFSFPLREKSSVFAGARFLQVDTRPEDSEIDNRVHMGIRWKL